MGEDARLCEQKGGLDVNYKRSKPARANGTGSGIAKAVEAFIPDNSKPLPEFQASFVAARYGLDGVRARVVAELAWGGR